MRLKKKCALNNQYAMHMRISACIKLHELPILVAYQILYSTTQITAPEYYQMCTKK